MSYYKHLTNITDVIGYTYDGAIYCPTCVPKTTIGQDVPAPLFEADADDLGDECDGCYTHIGNREYRCGECGGATDGVYAVDYVGALCDDCCQPYMDADAAELDATVTWSMAPCGGIRINVYADDPDDPDYEYPYLAEVLVLCGPADRHTLEYAKARGQGRAY